ncbi:MAG: SOS response-associated peptidase family protein, partial [Tissierellaceae bacterium]
EQLSLLDEANGTDYLAFTIITKEANNYLAKIHHRMPLIIDSNQVEDWFKGEDLSLFKSKEEQNMLYKLYAN